MVWGLSQHRLEQGPECQAESSSGVLSSRTDRVRTYISTNSGHSGGGWVPTRLPGAAGYETGTEKIVAGTIVQWLGGRCSRLCEQTRKHANTRDANAPAGSEGWRPPNPSAPAAVAAAAAEAEHHRTNARQPRKASRMPSCADHASSPLSSHTRPAAARSVAQRKLHQRGCRAHARHAAFKRRPVAGGRRAARRTGAARTMAGAPAIAAASAPASRPSHRATRRHLSKASPPKPRRPRARSLPSRTTTVLARLLPSPTMFRLRRASRDRAPRHEADGAGEAPDDDMNPAARHPAAAADPTAATKDSQYSSGMQQSASQPPQSQSQAQSQSHSQSLAQQHQQNYQHQQQHAPLPLRGTDRERDRERERERERDPTKHWSLPSGSDSPALGADNPVMAATAGGGVEPAPDLLTRAFNAALQPYQERVRRLETELARAQQAVATLEADKAAVHNWIDRRGLRPDLPPELAHYFAASPVAAGTLAAQLERKMTMLNYSLHQLGDVLPAPPPASTVTSALAALLPTVHQLASLPGGAAGAFEALIKLAGNLNSHGTGDETEEDRAAIASFYAQLDDAMVRVVATRAAAAHEGAEDWDVSRDLERLQRTGAFLKKEMGVRNYFVRAQEAMRVETRASRVSAGGGGGGGGGAQAAREQQRVASGAPATSGEPMARYGGEMRD